MTFVFEIDRGPPIGLVTASVRSPEFGDTTSPGRRQEVGETEAGVLFVQDLGVEREFFDATWTNLNREERQQLERFFGPDGSNRRQRIFTINLINNKCFCLKINTGMGLNSGQGFNTGDVVCPTQASFGPVRLEQSEISFSSLPRDRYTTSLRFRILKDPAC